MLDHMAALVGCYGSRGYAIGSEDVVAQIHSVCGWIVMVGELTAHMGHSHIGNAMLAQHHAGHIAAGHVAVDGNAGILFKFARE